MKKIDWIEDWEEDIDENLKDYVLCKENYKGIFFKGEYYKVISYRTYSTNWGGLYEPVVVCGSVGIQGSSIVQFELKTARNYFVIERMLIEL